MIQELISLKMGSSGQALCEIFFEPWILNIVRFIARNNKYDIWKFKPADSNSANMVRVAA